MPRAATAARTNPCIHPRRRWPRAVFKRQGGDAPDGDEGLEGGEHLDGLVQDYEALRLPRCRPRCQPPAIYSFLGQLRHSDCGGVSRAQYHQPRRRAAPRGRRSRARTRGAQKGARPRRPLGRAHTSWCEDARGARTRESRTALAPQPEPGAGAGISLSRVSPRQNRPWRVPALDGPGVCRSGTSSSARTEAAAPASPESRKLISPKTSPGSSRIRTCHRRAPAHTHARTHARSAAGSKQRGRGDGGEGRAATSRMHQARPVQLVENEGMDDSDGATRTKRLGWRAVGGVRLAGQSLPRRHGARPVPRVWRAACAEGGPPGGRPGPGRGPTAGVSAAHGHRVTLSTHQSRTRRPSPRSL